MEKKEEYYTTNNVSGIIKYIAITSLIIEIIICLSTITYLGIYTLVGIGISIISSLFIYGFGELIQIIHDIRTNSEHIRDYLESVDEDDKED